MKKLLIIPFLFTFNLLLSQDSYKVEISSGYIVMDKFYPEINWRNIHLSYFIQSQVTLWKEFDFNRKFNAGFGAGYTHLLYLDTGVIDIENSDPSYVNARFRVNHEFFSKKLMLSLGSAFYYYTKKTNLLEGLRTQYFANIEVGFNYKINNKFQVSILSPFTIFPMYYGHVIDFEGSKEPYILFGETTGFNIGLSYTFYQNKKKLQ
jgi:hypothetical protein